MSNNKISENIISNKLFNGVNSDTLNILNDPKSILELKEGTLIYSTGDESNFIYLLLRGEVKLKHSIHKKLIFKFKDDYFGEQEIIEKTNRKTSAVANSDCLLLKIPAELLLQLVSNSPELKRNLFGIETASDENANPEMTGSDYQNSSNVDTNKLDKNDLDEQIQSASAIIKQEDVSAESNDSQTEFTNDDNIQPNEISETANQNDETFIDSDDNFTFRDGWEKFQNILQPSDDLKRTAKGIVDLLLKQTDSEIGAFYLYHNEENRLEDYYQTHESFYKTKRPLKDGLTNLAAKQRKIIYASHFSNHTSYNEEIDHPNEFDGKTIIFIPLLNTNDELLAIVQIGSNQTDFSKDEEKKLETLASYCAMILSKSLSLQKTETEEETTAQTPADTKLIAGLLLEDVKNPLQNIRHYTSILSRFNLNDEVKKVIALISAQSTSTIDVLQSIIDYYNKNYNSEMEMNNFNEVVNQTLILLSDFVESKKVKLFKKLSADSLINIDARKFYVACYFITKFSCNMMPEGGKLYFSATSDDSRLELIIKDENTRLQSNELQKILDNYYYTDKNDNTINGLAVPKFLIETMNGVLKIETTASGTSYRITFPRVFS